MPQPRYAVAPTLVEAQAAAERIGYPLVVKPPDRQGQKGLALARTPAELDAAFEAALGASRGGLALARGARGRAGGDGERLLGGRDASCR